MAEPTQPWVIGALLAGAGTITVIGWLFARAQNQRPKMGGRISRAKQVWLVWAVYAWFVAAPLVGLAASMPADLRAVLLGFSGFMWARGVVEIVMLYVTKNWRPPLGIAHDGVTVVFLVAGLAWVGAGAAPHWTALQWWGVAFLAVLTASLMLETYFAIVFHRAVDGRTTGDDGVWFASSEDPRFRRVNRVTAWANVPLSAFMAIFLFVVVTGP